MVKVCNKTLFLIISLIQLFLEYLNILNKIIYIQYMFRSALPSSVPVSRFINVFKVMFYVQIV